MGGRRMKIIFMGTPEFAVPSLEMLLKHHEVVAVVTQPDKPKGRGKKLEIFSLHRWNQTRAEQLSGSVTRTLG